MEPGFAKVHPLIGGVSLEISPRTSNFEKTSSMHIYQKELLWTGHLHHQIQHLAWYMIYTHNMSVPCDAYYADTSALYDGPVVALLFVVVSSTRTQVINVYGIKTYKEFVNSLEDNVIQ